MKKLARFAFLLELASVVLCCPVIAVTRITTDIRAVQPIVPTQTVGDYKFSERDLSPVERSIIADAVRSELKDPESARFKWGSPIRSEGESVGFIYCGLVTAKNSLGGYTGDEIFMVVVIVRKSTAIRVNKAFLGGGTVNYCDGFGYHEDYFEGLKYNKNKD